MPTDRQRREAERRRAQRQLLRRREKAARRRRINVIVSIVGALVVAAVITLFVVNSGSSPKPAAAGSSTSTAPTAPSSSASATVAKYPCTWTKSGTAARAVTVPSTTTPSRTGTVPVTLTTTRGAITVTLNRAEAPCAVESFVSLARQKYFDNTPCHRLVSSTSLKVLQCGDPKGTGAGGPGYSFADELSGTEKYTRGVLAMANAGANTNGSQFFMVYGNSTLPAAYTIFGTITKGLPVIDAVAAKGSTPATDGKPKESISITKASVA